MTSEAVRYARQGDIALITIHNPPVNAAGLAVRVGLMAAFRQFAADPDAKLAVLAGAGRSFIAGADIREFGKPPAEPYLPDVIAAIEAQQKPVVAAIHGTALGGGLETALGCHYRVAVASAKLGLPEVNLGIIPGAGGTQRLPRLIGIGPALDIITSARHVPAAEALKLGIIDAIVPGEDPVAGAVDYARDLLARGAGPRRTGERALPEEQIDEAALRAGVVAKARGQQSPVFALDAVLAGRHLSFADGLKREREIYLTAMATPQREALIHAFFGERAVAKVPGLEGVTPRSLERIGVIGGGTMGAGITMACLNAGLPVQMVERDAESAERGRANVTRFVDEAMSKGRIDAAQREHLLSRCFAVSDSMAVLRDCDLIIEAAFEDMAVKQGIFRQLDAIAKPGAVLATNTSYLDINQIAAVTSRPADVIGLHFFSPAHIMRLLEVVVTNSSALDVVATGFALAGKLKKVGIRASVCDGFIGNRILERYLRAAAAMVEDGADPYEIDKAVRAFGFPMGPHEMGDLAGLDIGLMARKRRLLNWPAGQRYPFAFADRIAGNGWLGQKTGRGYYRYEGRKGTPDPEVMAVLAQVRREKGITPRNFSHDEIMARYMAAMINEGARVVAEGIALRPVDVDMTMLFGYGFPRWRGGPLKYADMTGLRAIVADTERFAKEDANFWTVAPLLRELAQTGATFDSLNR